MLLSCLPLAALPACRGNQAEPTKPAEPVAATARGSAPPVLPPFEQRPTRAPNSAAVALAKALQQDKLPLPARRDHAPQLAFGRGVFGQLTRDALVVYDDADFRLLATEPLQSPRAVLALADGSLLALGATRMLRWERDKKRATALPKPVVLPRAQLYADAQQPDLLWIFDGDARGDKGAAPATLFGYRLQPADVPLLLPERSIELTSPRGGVFGVSREGVWLYVTSGRVERLSPGGLRLPGFAVKESALPTWVAPARRLDQSLWLDEAGSVSRVLVSPAHKVLSRLQLAGRAVDADVGNEGQLLAVVAVTGPGPRFELLLFDSGLAQLGRAVLPSESPTGADDWVKVVTENQNVVVAARGDRVAVGGPARVTIFDAAAKQVFSIPSN